MATVIKNQKVNQHSISKYAFKVFGASEDKSDEEFIASYSEDDNPSRRTSDIDSSSMTTNAKEALIESLMKKTDEMSSNFIKLQMKLEAKDEEHKEELKKVKEESFAEGVQSGQKAVIDDEATSFSNAREQFATSITTLEETAKKFEKTLENIKSDLIIAAVDISQEVINVELSENSNRIASLLGDSLIKELQSASKITLKVNPKNHGAVSEHVGSLEHIQIVSDSAVSEGGVIAISDVGNMDSQISKRFERVKKTALSE